MKIGDKVRFVPAAWTTQVSTYQNQQVLNALGMTRKVTGRIVGIHPTHGYIRVRYTINGVKQHECFKIIQKESGGPKNESNSNPEPEGRRGKDRHSR